MSRLTLRSLTQRGAQPGWHVGGLPCGVSHIGSGKPIGPADAQQSCPEPQHELPQHVLPAPHAPASVVHGAASHVPPLQSGLAAGHWMPQPPQSCGLFHV
jgi:hypothetical protein